MPCYPCVLACDKGTIKIRVCFRSVVVPVVVGLGRNARACRDRPRGVICRPPDTRVDSPPHVGTDPVSVRYSRWIRSHAGLFRPCRTGAADRHGVCPYMRAERPSWQGARINEILERPALIRPSCRDRPRVCPPPHVDSPHISRRLILRHQRKNVFLPA